MTADFVQVCDALISDLQTNVDALSTTNAVCHKYAPWDPEEFQPDVTRQWAVWPAGEVADGAEGMDSKDHLLTQIYEVVVWEQAPSEERGVRDESSAATFLQLHNDIRARVYVEANQQLGPSLQFWYQGAEFGTNSQRVRWMRLRFQRLHPIGFS